MRSPRTWYCFSIHRPGEEVQWSLALEQVWWPILFLHNFGVQFIPFKLEKLKKNKGREKLKACTMPVTWVFKLWPWKKWLKEIFWANILFKFKWFFDFDQIVPYAQDFLPVNFSSSVALKTLASRRWSWKES